MSVTPKLSTAIRSRIERRDRQAQTAFPAKVTDWDSSTNTVDLEPQFVETWVTRDGDRQSEVAYDGKGITDTPRVANVPVCFPRFISWDITAGEFGLVICTKYSLDQWRQQRRRMDPGDLRRFTMSGATFHPVLMDETPGATQQFVALQEDVDDIKIYLDHIKGAFNAHTHTPGTYASSVAVTGASGIAVPQNPPNKIPIDATYTTTLSSKVKVE